MRRMFNFLLGAGIGALVGATIAVLLAPSSGDDLRAEVRARFGRFRNELREAASQRREELERQLQRMRLPQGEIPLKEE